MGGPPPWPRADAADPACELRSRDEPHPSEDLWNHPPRACACGGRRGGRTRSAWCSTSRAPRFVTRAQAAAVCAALPPLVSVVGVFVNPAPGEVEATVAGLPVDLLQFHGEEPPELCAGAGKPYVKAVRVRTRDDVVAAAARHPEARALLLDAHHDALWGGTGTRFDWGLVPSGVAHPIVLAGGLTPENVAGAIRLVRPFAVDVSGGVESAPGEKDPERMERFMKEVASAEADERPG